MARRSPYPPIGQWYSKGGVRNHVRHFIFKGFTPYTPAHSITRLRRSRAHPLRNRTFQITGITRCAYDDAEKWWSYETLEPLFRIPQFDFMSPWEERGYITARD